MTEIQAVGDRVIQLIKEVAERGKVSDLDRKKAIYVTNMTNHGLFKTVFL